jgi:hypothetical protein
VISWRVHNARILSHALRIDRGTAYLLTLLA